jgi:GT2 family glycosyltransferase/glycosyltransferase involved in cell wall biosynthesis
MLNTELDIQQQSPQQREKVSVVILNYNGRRHTEICLQSLSEIDYPQEQVEIIVVDNGSKDDSVDMIKRNFPGVRVLENEENFGFARAANQGAAVAQGEYVVFLNNDMRVDRKWLTALVEAINSEKRVGCVGSAIMSWDGSAIDFMGRTDDMFSLSVDPAFPPPRTSVAVHTEPLLFVSGGSAMFRRHAFDEVGGFDPDFFMYHEDVDLGWRLWLRGYKCLLAPGSVAYHRGGASSGKLPRDFVQTLTQKHTLYSIFKNFDDTNLREILPLVLYFLLVRSRWAVGSHVSLESVVREFESDLESLIAKRRVVQSARAITDSDLFSHLGNPFGFLLGQSSFQLVQREIIDQSAAIEFDPNDARRVRTAIHEWLNAAHFAYERRQTFEIETLSAAAAEATEALQLLSAQIDPQQRAQKLLSQIRDREQQIRELELQIANDERSREELLSKLAKTKSEVSEKDRAVDVLLEQVTMKGAQLDRMTGSVGWQLLSRYGKIKYRYLLPLYRALGRAAKTTDGESEAVYIELVDSQVIGQEESVAVGDHQSPAQSNKLTASVATNSDEFEDASAAGRSERVRSARALTDILNSHPDVKGVVVFPPTIGWQINLFQRPQQLALALARQNYLVFFHIDEPANRETAFQSLTERLYLSYIPFDVFGLLQSPIVFALSYNRELLRHFRDPRVVYELIDELEIFPGDKNLLEHRHATLLEKATVAVATATRLLDKLKPIRPDAILVPNGVDFEHFAPAGHRTDRDPPIELAALVGEGKPIVGYYGAFARWIDYELIRFAATRRPDLNFLLIGPDHDDTLNASRLSSVANVRWFGPRSYQDLPDFLRYFDVAIIPFQLDNITLSVSPIKLFEYLAAGKPVITTDLPECRKHEPVMIAHTPEEFVSLLDPALKLRDDDEYRARAVEIAFENTWDQRVSIIMEALEANALLASTESFQLSQDEAQQAVEVLSQQMEDQRRTIEALAGQVRAKEEEKRPLLAELHLIKEEKKEEKRSLEAQLDLMAASLAKIERSMGWRLLSSYGKFKYRYLLPVYRLLGSLRLKPTETTRHELPRPEVTKEQIEQRAQQRASATQRSYDVVCLPIINWDFRFQRPQQLLRQFANDRYRVFYVRSDFHQSGPTARSTGIENGVFDVQLPGPATVTLYRDQIDAAMLSDFITALEDFRGRVAMKEVVCIVQLPFWAPLAVEARRRWGWKIIYDCLDEHSGFSTNEAVMLKHEKTLMTDSDLVLATSRDLYDKISPVAKRILRLPNATDFDHFNQPGPVHPLAKLKKPIIGYYGAISDWFDVEMVRTAAQARPEWQFVLVGDTFGADVSLLQPLANVHLLGEQPYAALPSYLHQFDVATIPFLKVPLTQSTNPVKFYEYLSAGKPVVATELPELEPYRNLFYPVNSSKEFLSQLENALAEQSNQKVSARIELARENTWHHRYRELSTEVTKLYGKAAIVIVSYKNLEYIWLCLESIWEKTLYPNFEVIVVDNASGPDVVDYLKTAAEKEPRLKVILNEENLGFARANNIGIEAAGACEYVVLLNNDTIVTRRWLPRLIEYLQNEAIGMVGPVTNNIGNEAKINVSYQGAEGVDDFAEKYVRENAGRSFDIPMLAMFCVAMRRGLLDQIGMLDEQFRIGMFEDDDFALRVRGAGYRVVCAEDIFIHHWGQASFNQMDKAKYFRIFVENREKFEAKWKTRWKPHKFRGADFRGDHFQTPNREMAGLDWNEPRQLDLLREIFPEFRSDFDRIPVNQNGNDNQFYLNNGEFEGTDALVLYCMLRHFRPRLLLHQGSGLSLKLCALAAQQDRNIRLECVEPNPGPILSSDLPGMSKLIVKNLRTLSRDFFQRLVPGDILFISSSHAKKGGEDVDYLLLDVLPNLNPGVLVHVRDIFLPQEFPIEWIAQQDPLWLDQCMLQSFLTYNSEFEVLFANAYMGQKHLDLMRTTFPRLQWWNGGSFWMRRKPR